MQTILIVVQLLLAIGLVAIILVQRGAGASAGAAFGSGASGTVFGARGASSFLTRTTSILATSFFVISMTLAVLASKDAPEVQVDDLGVMSGEPAQRSGEPTAPFTAPGNDVPDVDSNEAIDNDFADDIDDSEVPALERGDDDDLDAPVSDDTIPEPPESDL